MDEEAPAGTVVALEVGRKHKRPPVIRRADPWVRTAAASGWRPPQIGECPAEPAPLDVEWAGLIRGLVTAA